MAIYRGFSTIDATKKFKLTDIDLVKRDLLNNFSIRKGEKLMNPKYGTIIWNCLFEPLTPDLQLAIQTDVQNIVSNDPRVVTQNITLTAYEHGIMIQLDLAFVLTSQVATMMLNFDGAANKLTLS